MNKLFFRRVHQGEDVETIPINLRGLVCRGPVHTCPKVCILQPLWNCPRCAYNISGRLANRKICEQYTGSLVSNRASMCTSGRSGYSCGPQCRLFLLLCSHMPTSVNIFTTTAYSMSEKQTLEYMARQLVLALVPDRLGLALAGGYKVLHG